MGKLIISRRKEWQNRARNFGIYIDGEKKDIIKNGEIKELEIEPGKHKVLFKIDWCSSPVLEIEIPSEKSKSIEVYGYKAGRWMLPFFYIIFGIYVVLKMSLNKNIVELIYLLIPFFLVVFYYQTFGRKKYIEINDL